MYEKIKAWYRDGRWTQKQVAMAVQKGVITQEQYLSIIQEEENGSCN